MSLRRKASLTFAAAAVVITACAKDVKQTTPAAKIVVAAFSPPSIPTPNDLALQAAPGLPDSAQKLILEGMVAAGGFPYDQAPTLTVPLKSFTYDAASNTYVLDTTPPSVNPSTLTTSNVALFRLGSGVATRVSIEPAATQTAGSIALVPVADASGSRRLAPGRYVFAVRGGADGPKTSDGLPINPDQAIALTIPNKDLTAPSNQPPGGLTGAQITQLEGVRGALWSPITWSAQGGNWAPVVDTSVLPAYAAVDAAFPHTEVASIAAFAIAPSAGAVVLVDSASGEAPLPFDLLRTGPNGTIAFNPAFGAAAEGLTTLDGFSTTAMMLAQTSVPVDASTVVGGNVFLYKLNGTDVPPTLVKELKQELGKLGHGLPGTPAEAGYVAEPTPIIIAQGQPLSATVTCPAAGGCSPVIGLQPGVSAPTPLGTFYLPPLEEGTSYAVVVTNRVMDITGAPLAMSTVTKLLVGLPASAALSLGGHSLVGGIDDATAVALDTMRGELAPVLTALGADAANIASAYTFKTQSITHTALQLAAMPYDTTGGAQSPAAATVPTAVATLTTAEAAAQYGIPEAALAGPASLPTPPIAELAEVKLNTVSLLLDSQNSGAFDPAHPAVEPVTALVVVPKAAYVAAAGNTCPGTTTPCAPLVVFRHGITRSKADVLPVAAALAARGFVVAAIDAEKHGDRSYCTSDAQCCPAAVCGTASTCAIKANLRSPVDSAPIGVCESSAGVRGSYLNKRVDCATPYNADGTVNPACLSPKGVPYVSASFLVSMNFFRTRDSLRQDIIDQSALIKALAPTSASGNLFVTHLATTLGYGVDPTKIYWLSQSLGSMQGVVDMAVNPRISRAVLNVGGATTVDIFANPESAFHANLLALLAPVTEGSAAYLQTLQVAKWILDPSEPANFAKYVIPTAGTAPLVSPLNAAGIPFPASRPVLAQYAMCDGTIPNAQNAYLAAELGLTVPAPTTPTTGRIQWYSKNSAATCTTDPATTSAVTHGFLLNDGGDLFLTGAAQTYAGGFLASPADVPTTVAHP
jgi:hypothetical protein